ncbi:MAG: hypothetical protein KatS3mg095_0430 [Candidatus Parcubacteria bacterium]|nr:MAG: hypothetical protein KatS3mg095_0430 [Candidatus Parcubacteria bacterium]
MENISKRSKEGIILENGKKLIFEEIEGKRIYNPTAPFKIGDEVYMVCRVEDRSSGKSMAMLFQLKQDKWFLVKDAPIFNLEDPFITHFKNGVLFGGVDVKWHNGKIEYLKTNFYYGKSFFDLDPQTPFAQGPLMMKDIRIVEIDNGFGVFYEATRWRIFKG